MKFLVIAFVCFACVASVFTDEHEARSKQMRMECQLETGVDDAEDIMAKWRQRNLPNDSKTDEFLLCYLKKKGSLTETGDYQVDKFRKAVENKLNDDETVEKVVKECTKEKAETPEKTARRLFECFLEHTSNKSE